MSDNLNIGSRINAGNLEFYDKLTGLTILALQTGANRNTGQIAFSLFAARTLASNDTDVLANEGGMLAKNSDPLLERSNGATDKSVRVSWASASVKEIQLPVVTWPSDLDPTQPVIVKLLAGMKAASVNTPVIAVGAFEGVGGTNLGGNTAALSTTLAVVSVSLTVVGYPGFISLSLTPGAHATGSNDVYLYGAWMEFARK